MPKKPKIRFAEIVRALQKLEAEQQEELKEDEKWQSELVIEDAFAYVFICIFLLFIGLLYLFGGTLDSVKKS